ncbi:MAG TPA: flagellar export chaperone FliS [Clostridiaceae bacterium]|nr:flagellar export chaperone FliS [Clostridiaceae bacterium]
MSVNLSAYNQYNQYNQYKQSSVYTATPEELTLMLYNGLIKFIMQAQDAIKDKNFEKAHESIIRAEDIIDEFKSTLDMQYDVSKGLSMLYDYMNERLMQANIKKDSAILEEVLNFAKELRDTWSQAMKLAKKQSAGNNQLKSVNAK